MSQPKSKKNAVGTLDSVEKKVNKSEYISVRVPAKTKQKMDTILKKINKDRTGKKIKICDIVEHLVEHMAESVPDQIRQSKITNKEKLEYHYKEAARKNRNLTRDQFLGMILQNLPLNVSN